MNFMSGRIFIDTNIWVYAHLECADDVKTGLAADLVERHSSPVISTQVLSEYYAAMQKNHAGDGWIQENIEALIENCEVRLITLPVIRRAHQIRLRFRFSYWDSLIVSSALDSGCPTLYTEDLQNGQVIDGLAIVNPFAGAHNPYETLHPSQA